MLLSVQQSSTTWADSVNSQPGQWRQVLEGDNEVDEFDPTFETALEKFEFGAVEPTAKKEPSKDPSRDPHQLSAHEAAQLLQITASRVKVTGPKKTVPYRRPSALQDLKAQLSSAHTIEVMQKFATVSLLLFGVGFFLNHSSAINVQAVNQVQAQIASHHKTSVTPVRHLVATSAPAVASAARVTRSAQAPRRFSNAEVAPATAPAPAVIESAPIAEYKGPSSLTGAPVTHRHAYQTASIATHPVQ